MRYLKSFESITTYPIIETINYVMLNFIDMGFEELDIINKDKRIIKKYTRLKKTKNLIQLNGWIENGKMFSNCLDIKNLYTDEDSDICNEFIDSIHTISSATNERILFSFTNHYDEDKILIYMV
jgi:uncharacterized protein YwqG